MTKRKRNSKRKFEFNTTIVYLGLVFSGLMFLNKLLFTSTVGWLSVFAPVLLVFFIIFIIKIIRSAFK